MYFSEVQNGLQYPPFKQGHLSAHLSVFPAGEIDVVTQEITHVFLRHLSFQTLQQVRKPFESLRLRTQPIEIDLHRSKVRTILVTLVIHIAYTTRLLSETFKTDI